MRVKASVGLAQPSRRDQLSTRSGLSILIVVGTARLRRLIDGRSTGVHLLAIGSSAFWLAGFYVSSGPIAVKLGPSMPVACTHQVRAKVQIIRMKTPFRRVLDPLPLENDPSIEIPVALSFPLSAYITHCHQT